MNSTSEPQPRSIESTAVLLELHGRIQGVGFRPFVARLAQRHSLTGWVRNDLHGVTIHAAGPPQVLEQFISDLTGTAPPGAAIQTISRRDVPVAHLDDIPTPRFVILDSAAGTTPPTVPITPDIALCAACHAELASPSNRRHRYPFITCTGCGPRYSIMRAVPYDRARTTMAEFAMCPACATEFTAIADRRFHAQPIACPDCGPHVELLDSAGSTLATHDDAVRRAADAILAGQIVAVKGIGGFHLVADATSERAVAELRLRKNREEKPLAVMFAHVDELRQFASCTPEETAQLTSPAAPIVLVRRQPSCPLAKAIAPGNPWIGALLPYSPLHVLLLEAVGRPVIATSGNLSEEPLCIGNDEARQRLAGIADVFLVHNREIARPIDDSVVRCASVGPIIMRRARGLAPTSLTLPSDARAEGTLLCVGGHLKSTIAVVAGETVTLSPHVGDLGNPVSAAAFRQAVALFSSLHRAQFSAVACDAHPDYTSTRFAASLALPVIPVQHHLAHLLSCLVEHHGGPPRVLGVVWDGTGYGSDGTIWGGEFILVDRAARVARRIAHLRPFRLPGGEAAIREPRRSALGLLHEIDPALALRAGPRLTFTDRESETWHRLLPRGSHAPLTTSAGRLFDGIAALLGVRLHASYEAQAALDVEALATSCRYEVEPWPIPLTSSSRVGTWQLDWAPMVDALLSASDRVGGTGLLTRDRKDTKKSAPPDLAARAHATLIRGILAVARQVGIEAVALTGGCFQNVRLLDGAVAALRANGFTVLHHRDLPCNDGGLSAGQALAARWNLTTVQ